MIKHWKVRLVNANIAGVALIRDENLPWRKIIWKVYYLWQALNLGHTPIDS